MYSILLVLCFEMNKTYVRTYTTLHYRTSNVPSVVLSLNMELYLELC